MINIQNLPDGFEPKTVEDIDSHTLSRYGILTGYVNSAPVLVLPEENFTEALFFASKLGLPIYKTDKSKYEKYKTAELEQIKEESQNIKLTDSSDFIEEDFNLKDFLKHSNDILSDEESAPIIKFVNSLFYQAIKNRASDIHIEAKEFGGLIRFRIDGALQEYLTIDKNLISPIINRLKVISHLDIAEKRVAQDGRTHVLIAGKTLDIRVSILPTYYGERIVMRILSHASETPSLNQLGFNDEVIKNLSKLLSFSYGIILVTGPTGSGKSTTLHACLKEIADPNKNLMSIEDPVEYKSDYVNQIQVNEKVGLTFASGLRSILRQDPDIVMVGEIRDSETAKIAVQAALTGHLTLSTLHTNDSISAIARLIDMGVENYLLLSTILGVLAQRLVRVLCDDCKIKTTIAPESAEILGLEKNISVYSACGCNKCGQTGYVGRTVISEFFVLDSEIRNFIKNNSSTHQIKEFMKKREMKTLLDDINKLVVNGKTSVNEAIRVGVMEI